MFPVPACELAEVKGSERSRLLPKKGLIILVCSFLEKLREPLEANVRQLFPAGQISASIPNWSICFRFKSLIPEHICISAYQTL